jgi:hypothetical protein
MQRKCGINAIRLAVYLIGLYAKVTLTSTGISPVSICRRMLCPAEARFGQAKGLITEISQSNPDASGKITHRLREFLQVIGEGRSGASAAIQQEREAIQTRLVGFDYLRCEAYLEFHRRDWLALKFPESVALVTILARRAGLSIDRESKRRKPLLFHWLHNHWDAIKPLLDQVELVYESEEEM